MSRRTCEASEKIDHPTLSLFVGYTKINIDNVAKITRIFVDHPEWIIPCYSQ